jgi:hypothetical protein
VACRAMNLFFNGIHFFKSLHVGKNDFPDFFWIPDAFPDFWRGLA